MNTEYGDRFGGTSINGLAIADPPPTLELAHKPISSNFMEVRSSRQLARRADHSVMRENYRALIAQTGLNNVAALSALESQLCVASPYGEERYKKIVDVYAVRVAIEVYGF